MSSRASESRGRAEHMSKMSEAEGIHEGLSGALYHI